jgi:hypothetical protein
MEHAMAKTLNLELQKRILELRQQGRGIRQISRELQISASRVSRALQPAATNGYLRELTERLAIAEQELACCRECMAIVSRLSTQWGRLYKDQIIEVLWRWPEGRFRQAYFESKL